MKQIFKEIFRAARTILFGPEKPLGLKCVIGLGNPSAQYGATRHNVGMTVVEKIARETGAKLKKGRGDFQYALCSHQSDRFLLVTPLTFMNESGRAAAQVMKQFSIASSDMMIVYDDFQLPLGTLRLREEGSDGGHNGLASITDQLKTTNIPRLRVGIAGKSCPTERKKDSMASYVLSNFDADEVGHAEEMAKHASGAALDWVHHDIEHAMNNYNKSFLE